MFGNIEALTVVSIVVVVIVMQVIGRIVGWRGRTKTMWHIGNIGDLEVPRDAGPAFRTVLATAGLIVLYFLL